jgi:uncharacterized membrane protein
MHGVERRHLDQHVGGRREFAVDKLQIAKRSQEGRAVAVWFVPSFSRFKAQRGKEARQPVIRYPAASGTKE